MTVEREPGRPTIPEILPWINEYYATEDWPGYKASHGMGGYLHIITEDDNTQAFWLPILEKDALEDGDDLGAFLCRALAQMSRSQRHRLYRDHSFYPDQVGGPW